MRVWLVCSEQPCFVSIFAAAAAAAAGVAVADIVFGFGAGAAGVVGAGLDFAAKNDIASYPTTKKIGAAVAAAIEAAGAEPCDSTETTPVAGVVSDLPSTNVSVIAKLAELVVAGVETAAAVGVAGIAVVVVAAAAAAGVAVQPAGDTEAPYLRYSTIHGRIEPHRNPKDSEPHRLVVVVAAAVAALEQLVAVGVTVAVASDIVGDDAAAAVVVVVAAADVAVRIAPVVADAAGAAADAGSNSKNSIGCFA